MAQGSPVENWMQAVPMLISGDSYCSGVLINAHQIATAYHCIASGKEAYVEWEDGTAQQAQVVSVDVQSDLAILSLSTPSKKRSSLSLRQEPIARGASVYALGHPFAPAASGKYSDVLRWSVAKGIVSQVGETWLQTDTPLNPGNSGGALVDEQGHVLGIVSHKFRAEGLSFVSRAKGLETLQKDPSPMRWFGGYWVVSPSISYPFHLQSSMSLDVNTSFLFRDRLDVGIRGRIYGNRMTELEERGRLVHYPVRVHSLGRLRVGKGQGSVVFAGGLAASYEHLQTYENDLFGTEQGYSWSWITQVHAGGLYLYLEGNPNTDVLLFGFGIESLSLRGVF